MSENNIQKIEHLESLTNLENLNLSDNQISKIEGLENLINLKELDLIANQIEEISGLENLKRLEWLGLNGNPILELKGLENLNELKVLLIGWTKIPQKLLNDLGGVAEETQHGEANNPKAFVEYCKKRL